MAASEFAPRIEQCVPDLQRLTHGQRQTLMIAAGLFVVWVLAVLILTHPLFCLVVLMFVCCCCVPGHLSAPTEQQQQEADDDGKELGQALAAFVEVCLDRFQGIH